MHKQLLKYVKVMGLSKKTAAAPHFLWDKGKDYGEECGTDREAISFLIQVNINLLSKWTLREMSNGKVSFTVC